LAGLVCMSNFEGFASSLGMSRWAIGGYETWCKFIAFIAPI
jgi:hypothetical protein